MDPTERRAWVEDTARRAPEYLAPSAFAVLLAIIDELRRNLDEFGPPMPGAAAAAAAEPSYVVDARTRVAAFLDAMPRHLLGHEDGLHAVPKAVRNTAALYASDLSVLALTAMPGPVQDTAAWAAGFTAARDYFGWTDTEADEQHGAECDKIVSGPTSACTCRPIAELIAEARR